MPQKRTIDSFFGAPLASKKSRLSENEAEELPRSSNHPNYPAPVPVLGPSFTRELPLLPARPGRVIDKEPDLDLLYFQPFIPGHLADYLFEFLRSNLFFYRVEYKIKRGGAESTIRTPRYTTVFGIDETSCFDQDGDIIDAKSKNPVPASAYAGCAPRPMPTSLNQLRKVTEATTNCHFNFCLVNYYDSGSDSIAFHSDDERFLGPEPAIASFSLGAKRDFLMKHKPKAQTSGEAKQASPENLGQLKMPLETGDMVLMRGRTQANWLHSIPKRSGKNDRNGGRINITFRQAIVKSGTNNYYHYNVGDGPAYKWDCADKKMKPYMC